MSWDEEKENGNNHSVKNKPVSVFPGPGKTYLGCTAVWPLSSAGQLSKGGSRNNKAYMEGEKS